jgi:para-nitrobenzyl esterase
VESAGGWSVCALLASPSARGLFAAAIMESGSCASRTRAQAVGQQFVTAVGCTDPATVAACLRATPEATLLDATAGADTASPADHDAEFTSGGPDLPLPPARAIADGDYAHVPILLGTNQDEARYFTQGYAAYTQQQYDQIITQLYGTLARDPGALPVDRLSQPLHHRLRPGGGLDRQQLPVRIGGCVEQNLAAQFAATTPTYFYQFDDEDAPAQNNDLPGFVWGAAHGEELGFLWPSFAPMAPTCTTCSPPPNSGCPPR